MVELSLSGRECQPHYWHSQGESANEWDSVLVSTQTGFVEIADRVFLARYPQWDVGVGLVVGADRALVVDTRASSGQGAEILRDVASLGLSVEVSHVVNTHVHFDHLFGNIAFAGATVHAHDAVARSLTASTRRIKALFRDDPGDGPEYGYTAADAADVLATEVRGPDRTFETTSSIDLGDRGVLLAHAGRGHTDGDIRIVVPDARVAFLGDLVEQSAPPSLGPDSWPLDWAATLDAHLPHIVDTVVVPGHGRPVDAPFVATQRNELAALAAVVLEWHTSGMALEEAIRTPDSRLPYPVESLTAAFERGYAQLDAAG